MEEKYELPPVNLNLSRAGNARPESKNTGQQTSCWTVKMWRFVVDLIYIINSSLYSLLVTNVKQMIVMYDLVEVKMDQKSFEKIGRYKRSKFSSCLVYDPLTDKTSLKQQPKWVIPGSLLGFGKCYFNLSFHVFMQNMHINNLYN